MKVKVYYIEDSLKDLVGLRVELKRRDVLVYPVNERDFERDRDVLSLYLQNGSPENRKAAENLLATRDPDVFLIDMKLWGYKHGGMSIFRNVLASSDRFANKKYIFISVEVFNDASVPMGPNYDTVIKIDGDKGINYNKLSKEIKAKIIKLLELKPSLWERFWGLFDGMEDAV